MNKKSGQKTYKITYVYGPFEDTKTVKAANKKDARKLSGIYRGIKKVELIA